MHKATWMLSHFNSPSAVLGMANTSLSRFGSIESTVSFIPLSEVDKSLVEPPQHARDIQYLTKKDCKLIEKAWYSVSDHAFLTQRIYFQFFMSQPHLKQMYKFGPTPPNAMGTDPAFKKQTEALARFLGSVVRAVASNNERQVVRLSLYIGVRHAQLTRTWFEPEWWQLFRQAILDCLKPYCLFVSKRSHSGRNSRASTVAQKAQNDNQSEILPADDGHPAPDSPAYEAWSILLDHVIGIMKDGFERCSRETLPPSDVRPSSSASVAVHYRNHNYAGSTQEISGPEISCSTADLYRQIPKGSGPLRRPSKSPRFSQEKCVLS